MNEEIIKNLNKILPVVERVHSDHHPELHQVAALYAELKQNPSREVFDKLRDVTKNYMTQKPTVRLTPSPFACVTLLKQ